MIFSFFQKNWVFWYSWSTLLWYRCYYPHRSRDALSPVCGIFSPKDKWHWNFHARNDILSSSLFAAPCLLYTSTEVQHWLVHCICVDNLFGYYYGLTSNPLYQLNIIFIVAKIQISPSPAIDWKYWVCLYLECCLLLFAVQLYASLLVSRQ